jgi:hypothetical protein
LAAVRAPGSLGSVGESMRAALGDLAKEDSEWLLAHLALDWFDRSVHRFPDDALISSKSAMRNGSFHPMMNRHALPANENWSG